MPAPTNFALLTGLFNKRGAVLLLLLSYPFVHALVMLQGYYGVDESLPKLLALGLSSEYLAPLTYGILPVLLILLVDSSRGRAHTSAKLLATVVILGMGIIRGAQTTSIVQSRYFLTRAALSHTDQIGFVLTPQNFLVLGTCLIPPVIAVGLIWTFRPRDPVRLPMGSALTVIALSLAMFLGAVSVGSYHSFFMRYSHDYGISRSPEHSFFKMLLGRSRLAAMAQDTLPPETVEKLQMLGINIDPHAPLPFQKPGIFTDKDELPWPEFENAPDIVLVFAESLSADLLGCYGSQWPGITPHMDAFAQQSMMFTNYYNHTTPTVTSLHGTLCSIYEVMGHSLWGSEESFVLRNTDVLSIAQVLRDRGYETTFLGCVPRLWSHFDEIMQHLGFEQTLFVEQIHKMFPEIIAAYEEAVPDRTHQKNLPDLVMFQVLRALVAKPSDRPKFTVITTVGTHFPYDFNEGSRYGDKIFLNALHNLDDAFKEIANLTSEQSGDRELVFILTGDHAMFPTPEHVEVRGPDYNKGYYDRLTLLIQRSGVPMAREIETLGSSVDLVPTLLHLLGIDLPNPFMGESIFSRRKEFPIAIGTQEDFLFFKTPEQEELFRSESLDSWAGAELNGGTGFGPEDLEQWMAYIRFLMLENRVWKR